MEHVKASDQSQQSSILIGQREEGTRLRTSLPREFEALLTLSFEPDPPKEGSDYCRDLAYYVEFAS